MQIAIVATARKLVCLCWTMIERGEDYAFARPSLTEKKLRALELRAGMPSRRGQKGTAAALLAQRRPPARARARRAGRARIPPAGRRLASQRPERRIGRGRRQWDATEKALCGASCAAGISPRTCASLGGRPRPQRSLTPADTRPQTTPRRGEDLARPRPPRIIRDPRFRRTRPCRRATLRSQPPPTHPIHHPNTPGIRHRGLDTFIRRVDHAADLGGEREERDHVLPGVQPAPG